jgi:hypothetical protein|tara:strand:- start:5325 stop:5744 length:420 start_codon:yes stop_codon:yes gene_type:complete
LTLKNAALVMMMVTYILSFSILGVQWEFGDPYGITLRNFDGVEIKSAIHEYVKQDQLNQYTENIVSANYQTNSTAYDKIETSVTAGAFVLWELIGLLTGTHVFYVMILLGVPAIFVSIFVIAYILLLAVTIISYLNRQN